MKIQKKYIGIVFYILLAWSGAAQNSGFYWNKLDDSSNRLQGKLMGQVYYITALANNNFLYPDEWMVGSVTLVDGDKFENLKLRYQVFTDELIAYNEKKNALYFVEKELVKSFTFETDDHTRNFVNMSKGKGDGKSQYFEELYSGSVNLVVFRYLYEQKVIPFRDQWGILRDIEYRLKMDYYMQSGDKPIQKILPKLSALKKTFPEHKKEIKKLFRKNDTYIHDLRTFVQAFRLLDEAGLLK